MRKRQLERLVRAAGKLAQESEFFVIGSQAVHAVVVNPPAEVLLSRECDLYPKNRPEFANLIHQRLGPASRFARQEGYFADVVTPDLATLPAGWTRRVKPLKIGPITAWCLEIHDLVVSKLAAARLKDVEFAAAMLQLGFAKRRPLLRRIARLDSKRDAGRVRARLRLVLDDIRAARARSKAGTRKRRPTIRPPCRAHW
jgi:hypothetical protein